MPVDQRVTAGNDSDHQLFPLRPPQAATTTTRRAATTAETKTTAIKTETTSKERKVNSKNATVWKRQFCNEI